MDRGAWWATVHGVAKSSDTTAHMRCTEQMGSPPWVLHPKRRGDRTHQHLGLSQNYTGDKPSGVVFKNTVFWNLVPSFSQKQCYK